MLFSRHFDLSRLDGVTVAYDYAKALASLDRAVCSKDSKDRYRCVAVVRICWTYSRCVAEDGYLASPQTLA